jgi:hypothetical protein
MNATLRRIVAARCCGFTIAIGLHIVGVCQAASPYKIIDLGTQGGTSSSGASINASGQVTGDFLTAGNIGFHAFFYDTAMHDLAAR